MCEGVGESKKISLMDSWLGSEKDSALPNMEDARLERFLFTLPSEPSNSRCNSDLQYDAELLAAAALSEDDLMAQIAGLRDASERSVNDRRLLCAEQLRQNKRIESVKQLGEDRANGASSRTDKLEADLLETKAQLQRTMQRVEHLTNTVMSLEATQLDMSNTQSHHNKVMFGIFKPALRSLLDDVGSLQELSERSASLMSYTCGFMETVRPLRTAIMEMWQALRMTHGHLTMHMHSQPPLLPPAPMLPQHPELRLPARPVEKVMSETTVSVAATSAAAPVKGYMPCSAFKRPRPQTLATLEDWEMQAPILPTSPNASAAFAPSPSPATFSTPPLSRLVVPVNASPTPTAEKLVAPPIVVSAIAVPPTVPMPMLR